MTKEKDYIVSQTEFEDLIGKYCRNYTALAKQDRFDPITGRDKEIENTILILLQKGRKNVCLLAPAGVGKTALVVGLAQYIVRGDVPDYLKDAQVLEADLAAMASGTSGPAEFQERFIPLCRGLAERYHDESLPKYILFIDEIHTIMPNVTGSAYAGLSEVMKPYLTVGDLHVIGATTSDEYRMFVSANPALDRRFQKVHLKVPNEKETVTILEALRPRYEAHHKIKIPDACLPEIVKLTEEHLRKRNQPDKSIIMMDAACAYEVMYLKGDTLSFDAIHYMISTESGIHQGAFKDDAVSKLVEK